MFNKLQHALYLVEQKQPFQKFFHLFNSCSAEELRSITSYDENGYLFFSMMIDQGYNVFLSLLNDHEYRKF